MSKQTFCSILQEPTRDHWHKQGLEAAERKDVHQAMFFFNSCLLIAVVQERKDLVVVYNTDFAVTIADQNLEQSLEYLKAAFGIPQKSVTDVSIKFIHLVSLNLCYNDMYFI